ncbi:MAG: hypothetical protein WCC25_25180, partial [Candidatus Korobacteraceae bacterium]
VDATGRKLQRWVLTNGQERHKLATFSVDNGDSNTNGVEVALEQIFEMRVPFELIGAQPGSRIRLRFAIWREHLPVDSLPLEGWIDLHAVPEEELETNLYCFSPSE